MIRELTIYRLRSFHDEMIILLAYSILKNEHALNREPVPLTKSDFEQNNLVSLQKRYPSAPLRDKNAEEKRNLEGVPFS